MSPTIDLTGDTLTVTHTFNAPRSVVFDAWCDPDKLKEWSCCSQASSMTAEIDFRVGGTCRTVMRIGGGEVISNAVYSEIDKPRRIAYTLNFDPFGDMPPMPETKVTIDFIERGEKTEVRLVHSELTSKEMRENVPGGTSEAFTKLAQMLESSARVT